MFEKSEESLGALETGGEIRNAGGRSLLVVVKPIATAVGLLGAMRITLDSAARAVAVGTADHSTWSGFVATPHGKGRPSALAKRTKRFPNIAL